MTSDTSTAQFSAIDIVGPDANKLLQGQLTIDIENLAADSLRHGAWLSPKGRVLTTLDAVRIDQGVRLFVPTELRSSLVKKLTMYRLRAKCDITATGASLIVTTSQPAHGPARRLAADGPWESVTDKPAMPDPTHLADRLAFGFSDLTQETSELFTAHQLNLDLLDAISFTKGCYTGQEIVARTEHLGRVKRRALRYRGSGALTAVKRSLTDLEGEPVKQVCLASTPSQRVEIVVLGRWPDAIDELRDADNTRYKLTPFTGYALP